MLISQQEGVSSSWGQSPQQYRQAVQGPAYRQCGESLTSYINVPGVDSNEKQNLELFSSII